MTKKEVSISLARLYQRIIALTLQRDIHIHSKRPLQIQKYTVGLVYVEKERSSQIKRQRDRETERERETERQRKKEKKREREKERHGSYSVQGSVES